jgi:SAM-dependent methyltransferase
MDILTRAIRESYDRLAPEYARRIAGELRRKPLDRQLLDRFAVDVGSVGEICDMGCGPGHVARYLCDRGANVFGIDLSPKMLEEARRLNPDIPFRPGDMLALDLPSEAVVGIAAFYAIVNIPECSLPAIFAEMQRVLRPGGLLLLAFHAGRDVLREEQLWNIPISMDFYFFDPLTIKRQLQDARFTIEDVVEREPSRSRVPKPPRVYLCTQGRNTNATIVAVRKALRNTSKRETYDSSRVGRRLQSHSHGASCYSDRAGSCC